MDKCAYMYNRLQLIFDLMLTMVVLWMTVMFSGILLPDPLLDMFLPGVSTCL